MARFEYECECGKSFRTVALEGEIITCPGCGKEIKVSLKQRDPGKERDFDSLVDATHEIMVQGGFAPSGAR